MSFPPGTEMFQFPGFASNPYVFRAGYSLSCGFPHSDIVGSKLVRSSPTLFAAYHVLHRLSVPRHPPNALNALDFSSNLSCTGIRSRTFRGRPVRLTIPDRKTLALTRDDHLPSGVRQPGGTAWYSAMIFPYFDHTDLRRYDRVRIVYFFTMSNNRQQTQFDDHSSRYECRNRLVGFPASHHSHIAA